MKKEYTKHRMYSQAIKEAGHNIPHPKVPMNETELKQQIAHDNARFWRW